MHACVCVLDWAGSWVFASTALLVAWTAMYLTSYSDYLTCFHDPLLPPYLDLTLVGKCLLQSLSQWAVVVCAPKKGWNSKKRWKRETRRGYKAFQYSYWTAILHEQSCLISWIKNKQKYKQGLPFLLPLMWLISFSQNYRPAMLFISCCCLHLSQVCLLPALNCA